MFLSQGIAVDTWVMASRDCDMSCEIVGDQAQFTFGHASGSLNLVLDQAGLAKLADIVAASRTQWQATPTGERHVSA